MAETNVLDVPPCRALVCDVISLQDRLQRKPETGESDAIYHDSVHCLDNPRTDERTFHGLLIRIQQYVKQRGRDLKPEAQALYERVVHLVANPPEMQHPTSRGNRPRQQREASHA